VSEPRDAREALIIEAIGEASNLVELVEKLLPAMEQLARKIDSAGASLAAQMATYRAEVASINENAKVHLVRHVVARSEEAARHSIEQQARAMTEAARTAFAAELDVVMRRLRERTTARWDGWLTHSAAAAAGATVALALFATPWLR
jgi:hypothetical protein